MFVAQRPSAMLGATRDGAGKRTYHELGAKAQQHAASPSSHETPPGVPHEWTWPTVTGLDLQLSVQSFSMELAPFIIFSSSYFLIFENVLLKKTECGKKPLYYYRRKGDIV